MQSKGKLGSIIAGVIAIFLILVCAFYLSFTFVSSSYESKAEAFAKENSQNNDELYTQYYKQYMDQKGEEKVYLGYTLNEVRKWGVGLGLDLKGGMNVILEVDIPDMLRNVTTKAGDANFEAAIAATDSIVKKDASTDYITTFVKEYRDREKNIDMSVIFKDGMVKNNNDAEVISALKDKVKAVTETAANNVLRKRIDQFGVVSPNIQVLQGKDGQILLELPGVKDHQRVRDLLQKSATLEFYNTYRAGEIKANLLNLANALAGDSALATSAAILANNAGGDYVVVTYANDSLKNEISKVIKSKQAENILPKDLKLRWSVKHEISRDREGNETDHGYALYALKAKNTNGEPALTGGVVTDASTNFDPIQGNEVSMRMNSEGAREWSRITEANARDNQRPVAIVLDDQVYSAPRVNTKIDGGSSQITGNFTLEEANDLVTVLKSGEMNAKINIISDMVIGPSLGQQAIDAGIKSFIVALVLLMIFMCTFYGIIPGLIADLCLVFNLFFTLGILASFQAVLTMSGIAGIVLSLGMAVDANVLIFERAKEELRAGKNSRTAIADGYSNAFSAIFDSNLTSIITGLILMLYGTGPIKGFATTLIIGIVCSFFTAVFLSRLFFIWFGKTKLFSNLTFSTPVSRKMFVNAHYNFLAKRKASFIVIGIICLGVIVSLCTKRLDPGIDFSGGRNYVARLVKAADMEDVRKLVEEAFPGASNSVINIESSDQIRISTNYKIDDSSEGVEDEIQGKLFEALKGYLPADVTKDRFSTSDSAIGLVSSQKVGPSVADDMRTDAYIAVVLSLIAMFLYILLRFRNVAFSLGALAAVAFTAFTIIGFYSWFSGILPFSMEVDQTFIAAILTVIGYQINDTVVVFDRVRENLALYPKQDFGTTINQSINSTLGRTIMTSASTLLVLICIFILGGDAIRSFVFAMLFGVIVGTFATIFLACPVAYLTEKRRGGTAKLSMTPATARK